LFYACQNHPRRSKNLVSFSLSCSLALPRVNLFFVLFVDLWEGVFKLEAKNVFERDAGTVLEIGDKHPLGQNVPRKRIYLRQCYKKMYDSLMGVYNKQEDRTTITITGTPGIGKSLFGLLFLIKLICDLQELNASDENLVAFGAGPKLNGRIIYAHSTDEKTPPSYYEIDVKKKFIHLLTPHAYGYAIKNNNTFLIRDGPCPATDAQCSLLWLSSPRAGSFQKVESDIQFILAPWTDDELVHCWKADCAPEELFVLKTDRARSAQQAVADVQSNWSDDEEEKLDLEAKETALHEAVIRRWAADVGPVARRVFRPIDGYANYLGALKEVGTQELSTLIEFATSDDPSGGLTKFKHSHRLLLMIPSADCTTYTFIPTSVKVGRALFSKQQENDFKEAKSMLGKMRGAHRGLVFEPSRRLGPRWSFQDPRSERK
jgi:hypothetical protein